MTDTGVSKCDEGMAMRILNWLRSIWLGLWVFLFLALWPMGFWGTEATQDMLVRAYVLQVCAMLPWAIAKETCRFCQKRKQGPGSPR